MQSILLKTKTKANGTIGEHVEEKKKRQNGKSRALNRE